MQGSIISDYDLSVVEFVIRIQNWNKLRKMYGDKKTNIG
jgi:hypothetical protein